MTFDPTFKARPLSPSAVNSFLYNPESWYETYILGKRQRSKEMDFGSMIDKRLETDPTFLPEVPRCPLLQHEMKCVFNGIHVVGKPDALDIDKFILRDFKTGKQKWDRKRADDSLQLTFYLLLVYIKYKIPPEKFRCYIDWLETKESGDFTIGFVDGMKVKTFETKRTMRDLLSLGVKIKEVIKEMESYALAHRLTVC
jgi:hypothetical protein